MHSREGPWQAVRQLLGLEDFVSFSSGLVFFFFPAGLGGWLGGGTCVQHLLEVFPQVFSSLENRGFGTLFYFLFYKGRDVCGFFYPRLRLFPPVWLPEAVINAHLCSVALLTEFI